MLYVLPDSNASRDPAPAWGPFDPLARRVIPSAPEPERSLERLTRQRLRVAAVVFNVIGGARLDKDRLVRALGGRLRDPEWVRAFVVAYCAPAAVRFLADLAIRQRIHLDDLPQEVRRECETVNGAGPFLENGSGLLHTFGVVFLGSFEERPAVYVPQDVRRSYAEALLGLPAPLPGPEWDRVRSDLEALVARMPPPAPPGAQTVLTSRARLRLPTPGPDRVLELDVRLYQLDVPIRRRLLVSYQRSLGALHEILRIAFGWTHRSRHHFMNRVSPRVWADPRRRIAWRVPVDEWKTPLRDVLGTVGAQLEFVLGPPSPWPHEIVTRAVHVPELVVGEPRLVEAEGANPPVGAYEFPSYSRFLAAWREGERSSWCLDTCGVEPDFDPDRPVDLEEVNRRLSLPRGRSEEG